MSSLCQSFSNSTTKETKNFGLCLCTKVDYGVIGTYIVGLHFCACDLLTHRNGFTPNIHKLLSHEALTKAYPMRLSVGSRPILVLVERSYVRMQCAMQPVCAIFTLV